MNVGNRQKDVVMKKSVGVSVGGKTGSWLARKPGWQLALEDARRNLVLWSKVAAVTVLIKLGIVSFTACDGNEPTPIPPTPPTPPVKVDTVRYENQTNLDKVPDALTTAKTVNKFADFSLAPGARIDFRAGDWNKLTQLLELLGIEAS